MSVLYGLKLKNFIELNIHPVSTEFPQYSITFSYYHELPFFDTEEKGVKKDERLLSSGVRRLNRV